VDEYLVDITEVIQQIEDSLVPRLKLDAEEARLYYHLFRHTRLVGKHDVLVSVARLAEAINSSKNLVKSRLRSLQDRGAIMVTGTGWVGTRVRVLLPAEIPGVILPDSAVEGIDIDGIDFYHDLKYRPSIFERENGRCFYCRRVLTDEDSGLDHVEPQRSGGMNSYKNVVSACHSCNSSKGVLGAEDFMRNLYRRGLLTASEIEERLDCLVKLKAGELRPIIR